MTKQEREIKREYLEITTRIGTEDTELFTSIVSQGIDAHLEAFTESKFSSKDDRLILNFHNSEIPILLRRLRELGTEQADTWFERLAYIVDE